MTILLKPAQVRAACGLIDWTATDLAARIGVSKQMMSAYLAGKSGLSAQNLEKIAIALESEGVEFTDDEGIRKKKQHVKVFEGRQGFWTFFDDIYEVAKNSANPNICIANVNEAEFDRWLGEYEPIHNKRMTDLKRAAFRVLLKENDRNLTSTTYCQYRWTKTSQFADAALYIYGDKSAFIQFSENDVLVTLVESAVVTDSLRKMFEISWENSTEIGA